MRRIMALPEHLKVKARAVFFAKQRKGDFRPQPGARKGDSGGGCGDADGVAAAAAAADGGVDGAPKVKRPRAEAATAATAAAPARPVCFAFQSNSCKRGAACKFQHVADETAKAQVGQPVGLSVGHRDVERERIHRPPTMAAHFASFSCASNVTCCAAGWGWCKCKCVGLAVDIEVGWGGGGGGGA